MGREEQELDACSFTPGIEEAEQVLARGFVWLRFPAQLESLYSQQHNLEAATAFRYRSLFILFLYLLLSTGIYSLMPEEDLPRWIAFYGWVGVIIVGAGVLSRAPGLDRWFFLYAGAGSLLAVAISVAITGIVRHDVAGQLTQVAIMYAVIIIYGIVGLSMRSAMVAGWGGGILGTLLAHWFGGGVDWDVAHRTYTGASLLGMLICYLIEHGHRRDYLQSRLLTLTQQRTAMYAEQVERLSRMDPLTGLANRRQLDDGFATLWRQSSRDQRPVAALMVDVDHFKSYNDLFGHLQGDECLRSIAAAVAAGASRPLDLAVRYGGEEFLLILADTDMRGAEQVAGRVREAVAKLAIPRSDQRGHITVSIGVASRVPDLSLSFDALLQQADAALYEAKAQGRDRVVLASNPGVVRALPR